MNDEVDKVAGANPLPVKSANSLSAAQGTPGGAGAVSWRWRAFLGTLVLALYWLYGWRPFSVHTGLIVDEALYLRHARGILDWLQGRSPAWLGHFDCLLLAKAPLYGIWLAFVRTLSIPLRVTEFLLLLSGPLLLRRAVRPVVVLGGWRFAVVLCLLLANPLLPGDF